MRNQHHGGTYVKPHTSILWRVFALLLVLNMFMSNVAILPTKSSIAVAQTTADPGLDQYGGWKGLQGHNTTGHWTVELIGDRYWFVTPENNVLWVLGHQHCTPGPIWHDCPALGYAPTWLANQAKYSSTDAWANKQLERSQDWGFNSTLFMDWAENVPSISKFALLDVKYLAQDTNAALRADVYFVDVFNPRYAAECAKRAEEVLRPLVDDPWTIGVYLGNEQSWNGTMDHQIGLPNMFIELPPTAAGKQYWVNTFLKTRYPTVKSLNDAYGTQFRSWDDVLNCTSIADSSQYPQIHKDKVDFSGDIAEAYYKPMVATVRAVAPRLLILSDRFLPQDFMKYLDYDEQIWKVAGKYCDVFCINSYLDYVKLEQTDHIISDMMKASGKPILITEHSYMANDTSLPAHGGWVGSDRVATQNDRATSYVDYLNGLLAMKVKGPDGRSVNPFMGIVWHKWYDDPALGVGSSGSDGYNFGLMDGMDEAYTPLTDVMKTANSQVYDAITHSKSITVLPAPQPLTPIRGCTAKDGTAFSWRPVQGAASYTLLVSPEQAFPDEQTIRIDNIAGTTWTLASPLAQGHWWWCVKANEAATGNGGYYSQATDFRALDSPGALDTALNLENLNRVTFEDIWDAGGAASSYAFLDTAVKSERASSVRCVFTEWAGNKTGAIGRNDASVFVDCTGATEPWTGISLAVRPTNFYDTTGKFVPSSTKPTALTLDCDTNGMLVPSSKYLRVRVWDQSGKLFLEWPLDPEGKLPIGQWSPVTIPFGVLGPHSVSKIALTLVTNQENLAADQRLTINVDNIAPLTKADDDTAPPAPLITNMTLSSTTIAINLDVTDPESGIKDAQICIGKAPGASDLQPWTTVGDDLSLSVPLTAAGMSSWYVSAKAQNGAGTWSAVTTVDGSVWPSSTRVNSIALEHGSVSPAGTVLIPSGSAQSFSVTPDFGYAVHDVTVDGVSQGVQQTVTVPGDGKVHLVLARFAFDKNAWNLDRLPAQVKTTMTMPVGSTSYQKNGMAMTLDVPPYIDASSGRTLVPVRVISEGLGADVQWNAADRTVTLSFEDLTTTHVVKMTIGAMGYTIDEKSAWMDVAPVIAGGRTFVPLRAVSEALGAQVDWNADTRTVLVQGTNAASMPLNNGKTLKELYDAASSWDSDNDDISDTLEKSFLSGLPTAARCDRLMARTSVFSRMDDSIPAMVLPMLSLVSPVGVHGAFTKVHYAGRLMGYVRTAALEKGNLASTVVNDTEKWVVAPGPSLQEFLNNAVTTQGSGGFIPGESITVSDNQVTATCTGDQAAWFETWGTIKVPTETPGGAFGIQFRMTSTITPPVDHLEKMLSGNADFESYAIVQPAFCLIGSHGQWIGDWWTDFREIQIAADHRGVSNATTNSSKVVSTFPVLRSGQLYDICFSDGTGRKAVITLPDGTIVDDIDMTAFPWNDKGGCFPDHKVSIGLWINTRTSMTISDLAFVVPPAAP